MVLFGQEKNAEEPNTRSLSFGLFAHSFGFGFDVQHMHLRDNTDLLFSFSLSSLKNLHEQKIESAYVDQGGKDYIYGKKNYAYTFAPTFGISKKLFSKSDFNRVSFRANFSAGPLLTFLKPYYLEIAVPFNQTQAYVEVQRYDAAQHNYTNIVGEADFFLGMDELSLSPGLRGRVSGIIDFARSEDFIRGIEVGVNTDLYFKAPELMDNRKNQSIFVGGSIGILFGNSW